MVIALEVLVFLPSTLDTRLSTNFMIRWLFSKTIREAVAMRKHVHRWYCAQRDLLSPQAIGAVTLAMNALQAAIDEAKPNKGRIRIKMEELEFAANKWLKPYPNAAWRENVEVLLVAIAVAMGIRTFFIQPFKIPTGSMQPTLYGVTSTPDFGPVFNDIGSGLADRTKIQAEINDQLKLQAAMKSRQSWNASETGFTAFPMFILSPRLTAWWIRSTNPGRRRFFPSTNISNLAGRGTPSGFRRITARSSWKFAPVFTTPCVTARTSTCLKDAFSTRARM